VGIRKPGKRNGESDALKIEALEKDTHVYLLIEEIFKNRPGTAK
jgi:hypothetical protein